MSKLDVILVTKIGYGKWICKTNQLNHLTK